jgi:hypothetical protein
VTVVLERREWVTDGRASMKTRTDTLLRSSNGVVPPSDAELIESSSAEPEAFAGIFDRHFPAVYRFGVRRVDRPRQKSSPVRRSCGPSLEL